MKLPDRLAASSEAARLSEEREKLDRDAVRDWAAKWVVEHLKADEENKQFGRFLAQRLRDGKKALSLTVLG